MTTGLDGTVRVDARRQAKSSWSRFPIATRNCAALHLATDASRRVRLLRRGRARGSRDRARRRGHALPLGSRSTCHASRRSTPDLSSSPSPTMLSGCAGASTGAAPGRDVIAQGRELVAGPDEGRVPRRDAARRRRAHAALGPGARRAEWVTEADRIVAPRLGRRRDGGTTASGYRLDWSTAHRATGSPLSHARSCPRTFDVLIPGALGFGRRSPAWSEGTLVAFDPATGEAVWEPVMTACRRRVRPRWLSASATPDEARSPSSRWYDEETQTPTRRLSSTSTPESSSCAGSTASTHTRSSSRPDEFIAVQPKDCAARRDIRHARAGLDPRPRDRAAARRWTSASARRSHSP